MNRKTWSAILLGTVLVLSACNANEGNMNKLETEMNENMTNKEMGSEVK